MKEVLIFAGTTEGRMLSECLAAAGIFHTVCVATEYGEIVLKDHPLKKVHRGRMNREEIRSFLENGEYAAVVDATHPYAEAVTQNIQAAMEGMDIPCLRLMRETKSESDYEKIRCFDSNEDCLKALQETEGNILLTTGSKELALYCLEEGVKERLYVRVLPGVESIQLCMEQGIAGKRILALQGPFSAQMNEAMLRQYRIQCLVTKQSGRTGGYPEKVEAARRLGIPVFVIGRPKKEEGYSFREVCRKLEELFGGKICPEEKMEIVLAGVGMGSDGNLTKEVRCAIDRADYLLGAQRMIEGWQPRLEKKPFYRAQQIIPYLKNIQNNPAAPGKKTAVILFSGDTGFYSGAQALHKALQEEIDSGVLHAFLRVMPGISSISYLAACIGESWQDAEILSIHGKEVSNLAGKIAGNEKTFLLTSGMKDVQLLGDLLLEAGLSDCEIRAGFQLSYPEQKVLRLSPKECCELKEEGLYTCLIKNPHAKRGYLTHGEADSAFIRDKVPMTKEEVREVSICKLRLHKDALVYDIGSGTGSIAVEIAGLSDDILVYAIEHKQAAIELIEKNRNNFQLMNLEIVPAMAPEGLLDLPAPTHAFIGGSGGRMKEILAALYEKNPHMRVVINAISMETICEIKEILSLFPVEKEEVVCVQVSRAKKAGGYHLMQAENPVWICSFYFREE